MDKILAQRFSPFNFSAILGFPNIVLTVDEWVDIFPIFKENKEDNPTQHLREFHELMHQWEIHHEDVLMNMFMFSLAGDAHQWYQSLPPASIVTCSTTNMPDNATTQTLYFTLISFCNVLDHPCRATLCQKTFLFSLWNIM
jgi:hypothetical protein